MPDDTASFEHFQVARRDDGSLFELGRGAMGVTYKAYDTRLDGYVALKVINPGYLHDDVGRERFLREARAAAHLDHPNVAAIFHRGQEGGTYFYAMQFIEGETLDAYVRRRGPLPVPLALRLVLQAAQGLAAANARGLIHRDIKPANLMLVHLDGSGLPAGAPTGTESANDEDLLVKVIDFGLAKAVLDDKAGTELSLTGEGPIGTPYYMSPEQIDSSAGEVDARTDIYSLGVTLWYLLTGQPPFVGTQFQVFRQHIAAPPPLAQLPVAVPENVRTLLGRMMAKTPDERPANTRDLIGQLRELLRGPLTPAADGAPPALVAAAPPRPPDPGPARTDLPPALPPAWRQEDLAATVPNPPPASSADTHRPPPPLPSAPIAPIPPYSPAAFGNPSAGSTVPPAPYYPPPLQQAAAAPGRGRDWLIFVGVLVGALIVGGVPLVYFLSRSKGDATVEHTSPSPVPVASATPRAVASPTAAPATPRPAGASEAAGVFPAASPGANDSFFASHTLAVPGQYATIQAAIDAAKSGDTVKVGAGTFRERIVFKAGVRLAGAGVDATTVSSGGDGECLHALKCASGTITGITFEHSSPNPANVIDYVVWLEGSAVRMRDCRVRNSGSVGVQCDGGDTSVVEDCEVTGCHSLGLRAMGEGSTPTFRGNHVHHNGRTGITFAKGAAGVAENNTAEANTEFGFTVIDADTAPTLTGNTARRNTMSGFTYQLGGGGTAENNTVEDNKEGGFRLADKGTAPTISNNQVRGSGLSGFIFIDGAAGVVADNTIEENTGSGALLKGGGTAPVLTNNRLTGNKLNGIFFSEGAGGTAKGNTITGNGEAGVSVYGKGTAPTLQENQVSNNTGDGIQVRDGAGGTLEGNTCTNNTLHGIGVYGAGTSPTLGTNKTENNPKGNTYIEKGATPKKSARYDGFFR